MDSLSDSAALVRDSSAILFILTAISLAASASLPAFSDLSDASLITPSAVFSADMAFSSSASADAALSAALFSSPSALSIAP